MLKFEPTDACHVIKQEGDISLVSDKKLPSYSVWIGSDVHAVGNKASCEARYDAIVIEYREWLKHNP